MEVLEFGCGTGSTAITHAPSVKHIQAIDIFVKNDRDRPSQSGRRQRQEHSLQATGHHEYSAPDQTFDAVLALSILHLLGDTEEVISKVHKMLKPGGVFVTRTVCIGDTKMKFLKFVAPIARFFGLMPIVKVFTEKEFGKRFDPRRF